MKKIKLTILILATLFITACGQKPEDEIITSLETYKFVVSKEPTNNVLIDVKNYGYILVELYPEIAPISVKNFQNLVGEKFYDNSEFHRVVKGFVIQAGKNANKTADNITGEFDRNGIDNPLKHERGVLSMARTSDDYNSASSQFFIMHRTDHDLNGNYAGFGMVLAGMDTVDKIAQVEVQNQEPINPPVIKTMYFVNLEDQSSN